MSTWVGTQETAVTSVWFRKVKTALGPVWQPLGIDGDRNRAGVSTFTVHQKLLEDLVKHGLLGQVPRVSDSVSPGGK